MQGGGPEACACTSVFLLESLRRQWLSNVVPDLLSGTVVALALIPEAIAFSIIAGVDPAVGLYASFSIAVLTSFTGGRPAMVSAATGAMALVAVSLVGEHGVEYLFAATVLTGLMQLGFSALKLARYIKFVPQAVMTVPGSIPARGRMDSLARVEDATKGK